MADWNGVVMQGKPLFRTMRRHVGVRQAFTHPIVFRSLILCLLLATAGIAQAPPAGFNEFQAPDAGTATNQGTLALSINSLGVVDGYYYDSKGVAHGFVRNTAGTIT